MSLRPAKCGFLLSRIEPLGFRTAGKGLCWSLDKVQAARDYPIPSNQEELERFIYMTTYLHYLIPSRADHSRVLKAAILYGKEKNDKKERNLEDREKKEIEKKGRGSKVGGKTDGSNGEKKGCK